MLPGNLFLALTIASISASACRRQADQRGNWELADGSTMLPSVFSPEGTIGMGLGHWGVDGGAGWHHRFTPLPHGMKRGSLDKELIRRDIRRARSSCLPRHPDGGAVPPRALRIEARGKRLRIVSELWSGGDDREGTATEECVRRALSSGVLSMLKKDEAMDIYYPMTCSLGMTDE